MHRVKAGCGMNFSKFFHLKELVICCTAICLFYLNLQGAERFDLRNDPSKYSDLIQEELAGIGGSQWVQQSQMRAGADQTQSGINKVIRLDVNNELRTFKAYTNKMGLTQVRLQQYFQEIPIWGHHIRTSIKDRRVLRIKGNIILKIDSDINHTSPAISEEEALLFAKAKLNELKGTQDWRFRNEQVKLVIYLSDTSKAKLAYSISYYADTAEGLPTRPYFIINAQTKEIIKQWEGLTH